MWWMFTLTISILNHEKENMRKNKKIFYFNVRCNRAKQSAANRCFLERKNRLTSRSKTALGAKHPLANHINSQPRDSLP